jgi:hypothetical protein
LKLIEKNRVGFVIFFPLLNPCKNTLLIMHMATNLIQPVCLLYIVNVLPIYKVVSV